MYLRHHVSKADLKDHFRSRNMDEQWRKITRSHPHFFAAVWSTHSTLVKHGVIQKTDANFKRIRNGLITLIWALGYNAVTEILAVGQIPALRALMDIENQLLHEVLGGRDKDATYFNIGVALSTAVVKAISYDQSFEKSSVFTRRLVDEFEFIKPIRQAVINTAIGSGLGCAV